MGRVKDLIERLTPPPTPQQQKSKANDAVSRLEQEFKDAKERTVDIMMMIRKTSDKAKIKKYQAMQKEASKKQLELAKKLDKAKAKAKKVQDKF